MNQYLSIKFRIISFILMVLVVYLHSYNLEVNIATDSVQIGYGYNSIIQDFISNGIARIAVPAFFMISGYLFFFGLKDFTIKQYLSKISKRLKTLLLPYLLWSLFGLILYFLLQSIPQSKPFFTKTLISNLNVYELFFKLIYDPIPYQLWFIRDLILIVITSPLIYLLIKYLRGFLIFAAFCLWLINFDILIYSVEALFFFTLGSYLAINKHSIDKEWNVSPILLLSLWLILLIIKLYLNYINGDVFLKLLIHQFSILVGMMALWGSYDAIFKKRKYTPSKNSVILLSFFLFVSHEPLLTIIKKLFYFVLGISELTSLIIYIISPVITITICLFAGQIVKKSAPRMYMVLTGGR